MGEKVSSIKKRPEAKCNRGVSEIKKTNFSSPMVSPVEQILHLQRTIGNRAVTRLIESGTLQTRLTVSPPNDIYEKEADRVDQQVEGNKSMEEICLPQISPTRSSESLDEKTGKGTLRSWRADSDLWYFSGEPNREPHPTQVSLQADSQPSGIFLWSVSRGADKAGFVRSTETRPDAVKINDNQVQMKSKSGSDGVDDVMVRVTHLAADGTPKGTCEGKLGVRTPKGVRKIAEYTNYYKKASSQKPAHKAGEEASALPSPTSRDVMPHAAPKSLRPRGATHNANATWGYLSNITYEVLDDTGNPINGFDVNEQWTTGVVNDHPTTNWRRGNPGGYTSTTTTFSDYIGGESSGHVPQPTSPQSPLGTTRVQHWGQDWYIGSTTPGRGTKVQSNTLQKYVDHAEHRNITSPP